MLTFITVVVISLCFVRPLQIAPMTRVSLIDVAAFPCFSTLQVNADELFESNNIDLKRQSSPDVK